MKEGKQMVDLDSSESSGASTGGSFVSTNSTSTGEGNADNYDSVSMPIY